MFVYVGVSAYQDLLSTSTLLTIVYSWTPNKFERKIERRMHVIILAAATAIALVPLSTKTYNPTCGLCISAPTPLWCDGTPWGVDGVECVRGSLTITSVIYSFLGGLLVMVAVYCAVVMYAIYRDVRNVEKE